MNPSVAPERPVAEPWAYFLTIACYGARLHGDTRGSVDREHNGPGGRYLPEDADRVRKERRLMLEPPVLLSQAERQVTLAELRRSCDFEGWLLHAAHVRSTHLHMVVTSPVAPEIVMGQLKRYMTRALNERFGRRERRWVRHGSTVWLWDPHRLDRAVDYVVRGQGEPMALYVNRERWPEYMDLD